MDQAKYVILLQALQKSLISGLDTIQELCSRRNFSSGSVKRHSDITQDSLNAFISIQYNIESYDDRIRQIVYEHNGSVHNWALGERRKFASEGESRSLVQIKKL